MEDFIGEGVGGSKESTAVLMCFCFLGPVVIRDF